MTPPRKTHPSPSGLERKNHGRGHSYWIDGEKVPGVTTILGDGYPKGALVNWAAETTAGYAVDNWDDLAEMTPSQRLKALTRARWDVQREAAVRGTAIHAYAQRLAAGEEVDVADEYVGHVDSYLLFVKQWQPIEFIVERPFFSRTRRYAGTPDLVAQLGDGNTWILDWKTSEKGVFMDNVLQLAANRYAETVLLDDGREGSVADLGITHTGIVNVRGDGYDLVPVEAGPEAYRTFLYVREVAKFINDERENWISDALMPPRPILKAVE